MKRQIIIFMLSMMLVPAGVAIAQENKAQYAQEDVSVPVGMEEQVIETTKWIVPKGAKVYKKDNKLVVEDTAEYVARRLVEIEERIGRIEDKEKELDARLAKIVNAPPEQQAPSMKDAPKDEQPGSKKSEQW